MKARIYAIIFLAMIMVLCLASCNGCGEEAEPPHVHTEGEWIVDTEPTCITVGNRHTECTQCGEPMSTEEMPMVDHTATDWIVDAPPTCIEVGSSHKECALCGVVLETASNPALGHNLSEWVNDFSPTCTDAGYRHQACSRCGEEFGEHLDPLGHTDGEWVIDEPPTCFVPGTKHMPCQTCGETLATANIPPTGHTEGEWVTDKDPTCTTAGAKHMECEDCHLTISSASIPPLGHIESEWVVDRDATLTDDGSRHIECQVCHIILRVEAIPMIGHTHEETDWIVDQEATCIQAGSKHTQCTLCGRTVSTMVIPATGHTESGWVVDLEATCTTAGSQHTACTECGETLHISTIPASGHTESDWIEDKAATCVETGSKHISCEVCQETLQTATIPATGVHTYDEWDILREADCLNNGLKQRSCAFCDRVETETIPTLDHDVVTTVVKPTCTLGGYTKHECPTCGNEFISAQTPAIGHNYGDFQMVTQETCDTKGEYVKTCANCGDKITQYVSAYGHQYVISDTRTEGEHTYTTYICDNCGDTYEVVGDAPVPQYEDIELFDCEPSFTYVICSDGDESYIRQNLLMQDSIFYGTEYADHEDAKVNFNVVSLGSNRWSIQPKTSYGYGSTYIVELGGNLAFAEYSNSKKLTFTIEKDPNHEDTIVYNENVLFLKQLEENSPGYYPYEVAIYEDAESIYVMVSKIEGLAVGQILCVGDVTSFDDASSLTDDCYIGKIGDIQKIHSKSYVLRLDPAELGEIFAEFDVSYAGGIDLEENAELAEGVEDAVIAALYQDEDFLNFLNSTHLATKKYLRERNMETPCLDSKSFMDHIKLDVKAKFVGTSLSVLINGEIDLPVKAGGKEIGSIKVSFELEAGAAFDMGLTFRLKWFWFIPTGIKEFDLHFDQSMNLHFKLDVDMNVEYSLGEDEETPFALNTNSKIIHCANCLYVSRIQDKSKIEYISASRAESLVNGNDGHRECEICNPLDQLDTNYFVVNFNTGNIHALTCGHIDKMTNNYAVIHRAELQEYLNNDNYKTCDYYDHKFDITADFKQLMLDSFSFTDWESNLEQIKEIAAQSNMAGSNKKGITIATVNVPFAGILNAKFSINLVLDFQLEASLSYEYEYNQSNTFGIRWQDGGFRPYSQREESSPVHYIEMMGQMKLKSGIELDVRIGIVGIGRWANVGLRAGVGFYAEAAGIYIDKNLNDNNGPDYAAAYLEVGVYLDVEAYYTILFWGGTIDILSLQSPLVALGNDTAYYAYVTYRDGIVITDYFDIDKEDLLMANYYDLKSMESKVEELTLSENDKYQVIITFADGRYCQVVDGRIVPTADAPCTFTDSITITVVSKRDTVWYQKGDAVFYLGEYTIPLSFDLDQNHADSLIDSQDATCLEDGWEFYVCEICGRENKEVLTALGHNLVQHEAKTPTCTEIGWEAYETCERDGCGHTTYVELAALGHDLVQHDARAETCTEIGWEAYETCERDGCGHTTYVELAELGHDLVQHEAKTPTCTEIGWEAYETCSRDGCNHTTYKEIPALGHTPGEDGLCTICKENGYSLAYKVNADGTTCTITGMGTYVVGEDGSFVIPSEINGYIVTGIAANAFNPSGFYSVTIPKTVTYIGEQAFTASPALGYIIVEEGNPAYRSSGHCLIEIATKTLLVGCYNGVVPVIPDDGSVVIIGAYAFADMSADCSQDLTSIVIPEGVTIIGEGAFAGCAFLETVTLPSTLVEIGEDAFAACESLTSIDIPNGVVTIGAWAFGVTGITSVTIPNSVTTIGEYAFAHGGLTSIVFGNGIVSIERGMFEGCCDLTSVTIPVSVTSIGDGAFTCCENLTSITFGGTMAQWNALEFDPGTLNDGNEVSCYVYCTDGTILPTARGLDYEVNSDGTTCTITGIGTCELTAFAIPATIDGYTVTNVYGFDYCDSIVSVTFPDTVTTIEGFYGCTKLTSVVMGNGVTYIGEEAFSDCVSLTNLVLSENLECIYRGAFGGCVSLECITIPASVNWIVEYAFGGCSFKRVNITNLSAWCSADLEESILWNADLYLNGERVTHLVIPSGVTSIGAFAFSGCTSITSVAIPDSVTEIGNYAFSRCTNLTSITISNSVRIIGSYAFRGCTGLISITIPDSVTSIGTSAFYGCTSLTSVTIGNGVTSIGGSAFYGCESLISITIPDSVTSIGYSAFKGCTGLTSIIYSGTIVQWDSVAKGANWDQDAGNYTLHFVASESGDTTNYDGGKGTAGNPYLISNAQHLMNISKNMSAHFRLTCDIVISGAEWEAIGGTQSQNKFMGVLDGNGYSIIGLTRTTDIPEENNVSYFGLFGVIGSTGVVKNVKFKDVDVYITGPAKDNGSMCAIFGVVAGRCEGSIDGVEVSGYYVYACCTNGGVYLGGICGYTLNATISNCVNNINLTADRYGALVGGIVCYSDGGSISNCCNNGTLLGVGTDWWGMAHVGCIASETSQSNPTVLLNNTNNGSATASAYDNSNLLGGCDCKTGILDFAASKDRTFV